MAFAYIDTSAFAKWYLPEARSEEFAHWIQRQQDAYISSLSICEFRCLLARRQRMKQLTESQVQLIYSSFEQDINDGFLLCFAVTDQQIQNAILLIESLPTVALRTLDALHLSIARSIPAELLATADRIMIKAAEALRFQVVRFD